MWTGRFRCCIATSVVAFSVIAASHHSTRYVYQTLLQLPDASPTFLEKFRRANPGWRAVHKALWTVLVNPLGWIASAVNAGTVMDVIIKKEVGDGPERG